MFGLFKKTNLLSGDEYQFLIETYQWLLKHVGGDSFYRETPLVLPNEAFFPERIHHPEEAAEITFKYVKKHAGMEDWPCELRAQAPDPERKVAPTVRVQGGENSPLGTFSSKGKGRITITYNPELTANPTRLVATLAHELAHFLTATFKEPPPGGWENWEFATDVAAVFMGFGIFMANAAFDFNQFTTVDSQGWSTSVSGYLSEPQLSFALALFLTLKDIDPKKAYPYLDLNIRAYVKKSLKELRGFKDISALKVRPVP